MAASVENSQYERDLRSARKEWKRTKDSSVKWSYGHRHLAGIPVNFMGEATKPAGAPDKFRPGKKDSEFGHHASKPHPNLSKMSSRAWDLPASRRRTRVHVLAELEAATAGNTATADLTSSYPLPSPSLARSLSASNPDVLYSFDRADTPGRPLTLEVFVKKSGGGGGGAAGRETERLVAREYEVLDESGEAVRGRRARALLRRGETGKGGVDGGEGGEEDDGFELV